MSHIEKIDVSKIKQQKINAEKKSKEDAKIDKKFKIKAMKQPLNRGATPSVVSDGYRPTEYKVAPALAMVEGVSRGMAKTTPANYERMKHRLLTSPDIQYLSDKVFCNYEVESDKMKLLLTVLVHCGNELLTSLQSQNRTEEVHPAPVEPETKKEDVLQSPASMEVPDS